MNRLKEVYAGIKNQQLSGRYFLYDDVLNELDKLSPTYFNIELIGFSVLGRPIKKVSLGKGRFKLLVWSQMHGNESTSTKAIFDFFGLVEQQTSFVKEILSQLTIHIIPVLNPDGMMTYTRENANGVDLNRDAFDCKEPESSLLRIQVENLAPDFCFNMHGQRTIFSAGFHPEPATMSFLSPSVNSERSVTSVRKKVMQLVVCMNEMLQEYIPRRVGRYDDGFNINCTGDYYQSQGIPVVLFESGHFEDDYEREKVRMFTFMALFQGITSLTDNTYKRKNYKAYFDIPQNQKLFYDVIVRNVRINNKICSFAIQYNESLISNKLQFIPLISQVNGLESFWGHKVIDADGSSAFYEGQLMTLPPSLNSVFELKQFKTTSTKS